MSSSTINWAPFVVVWIAMVVWRKWTMRVSQAWFRFLLEQKLIPAWYYKLNSDLLATPRRTAIMVSIPFAFIVLLHVLEPLFHR